MEPRFRSKTVYLPGLLFLSCSCLACLLLTNAARCEMTSTGKSVADLQWFSGRWSCDGKFIGSGKVISADVSFEPVLENKWILFRHDDRPPFSYHALSEWGWDEKGQQYVSTVQDSTGGIRLFYSDGFSDSKLVWEGQALGNPAARAERFEFIKNSPKSSPSATRSRKTGNGNRSTRAFALAKGRDGCCCC
jgi:hypothetical protein